MFRTPFAKTAHGLVRGPSRYRIIGVIDTSCAGEDAAALHTAYACPNTRYLDLDGSFDLARDPAAGDFVVEDGCLRLLDRPGLGVDLVG